MSSNPASNPVICGVDGSDEAARAAAFGADLARELGLATVLSHFIEPIAVPSGRGLGVRGIHQAASDRAWELVQEAAAQTPATAAAQGLVAVGDPAGGLIAQAGEHRAALLVVGSKPRRRLVRLLEGSVARKLVAEAPCPVLVVPAGARVVPLAEADGAGKPIVCGFDGSDESRAALACAVNVAVALGARLIVAHAGPAHVPVRFANHAFDLRSTLEQDEAEARLVRGAADAVGELAEVEPRTLEGDPAAGLEELAEREDALLIAVGARGHGALLRALVGSTSQTLAEEAPRPLLACPQGAAYRAPIPPPGGESLSLVPGAHSW